MTVLLGSSSAGVDSANSNLTGNYVLARFDASGRLIIDTGSVAATGQ